VGGRAEGLAVGTDPKAVAYRERALRQSSLSSLESSLDWVGVTAAAVDEPVAEAAFLWMQLVATAPPLPLPEATGAAFTSGFTLLPPLAFAKSHEKAA
jgi:hypothetical protein